MCELLMRIRRVLWLSICFSLYILFLSIWVPEFKLYRTNYNYVKGLTGVCNVEVVADSDYNYVYNNKKYQYKSIFSSEELNYNLYTLHINENNDSEVYSDGTLKYYKFKFSDTIVVFCSVTIIFIVCLIGGR